MFSFGRLMGNKWMLAFVRVFDLNAEYDEMTQLAKIRILKEKEKLHTDKMLLGCLIHSFHPVQILVRRRYPQRLVVSVST